jgi:D-alanyl-lipoteichoic acid acyltransferase DltB (MBOAT superfamily)
VCAVTVTSLLFFACAVLAALVYHRLPASWRTPWLLLISAGFVATWSWQFVLVLLFYSWVNFALGHRTDPANPHHRGWARAGIVVNILFLFVFKYSDFFLPQFSAFLQSVGFLQPGMVLQVLLPVGLSFLTVQNISYLLDVSNKRLAPETSFVRFSVYIYYFPKLLSGPVERARTFLPKLASPLLVDRLALERSAALILSGLFRKLALANPLFNMIPAGAFVTPLDYSGQNLFFWLLAYAFALYNDFAGYTAIVRGVSLWFGIEFSANFNLPYYSRNFTEFWTRWHITLSNWLRDYIFFPLSRSLIRRYPQRNHLYNIILPPMLTLLVSGMWHGLSWNMLLWGGLHGLYLVLERLPSLKKPAPPMDERPRWRQRLGTALTFTLATLAWVPFRMELPVALDYWKGLLHWSMPDFLALARTVVGWSPLSGWSQFDLPSPLLILVLAAAIVLDALQHRAGREEFLLTWPRWAQVLLVLLLLLVAGLAFFSDTTAPFVYQGF